MKKREWLIAAREAAKLSRQEIALEIGVTRTAIHYIEIGQRDPTLKLALALADRLHFDPHKFLDSKQAS